MFLCLETNLFMYQNATEIRSYHIFNQENQKILLTQRLFSHYTGQVFVSTRNAIRYHHYRHHHHHHHHHHHRVCIHSWQRNPSLDWSHRCLCLASLDHKGPNCLVTSSLHLVFGRPCCLVQNLGVHSVALMVQRLSGSRAMWAAHLCFAFLVVLMISLTQVSCRVQVFRFRSRRVMPSTVRSILRRATA